MAPCRPTDDIDYRMENPQLIDKEVEALSLKLNADLEALKGLYEYDSSFEAGKGYPLNHASSKVRLNNSVLRLSRFYKFKQFFARR